MFYEILSIFRYKFNGNNYSQLCLADGLLYFLFCKKITKKGTNLVCVNTNLKIF